MAPNEVLLLVDLPRGQVYPLFEVLLTIGGLGVPQLSGSLIKHRLREPVLK